MCFVESIKSSYWALDNDGGSHKIIPHQFIIMNNIRVIYSRENLIVLDNSLLCEQEQSLAARSKRAGNIYSCFYSIRDHAQVGWYLKGFWLKEQNVLP